MAKKAPKNPTPALFSELEETAPVRPLPPTVQSLFLPKLVEDAARSRQLEAYAEPRKAAHLVFVGWLHKLRSGQLSQLGEAQLEHDVTTGLMGSLGYQTQGQVGAGQAWTLQTKCSFPNAGIADFGLGRFEHRPDAPLLSNVLVVGELKGPKADLDKRDSATRRTPVQQAWDYLSASETARWAVVSNCIEFRLYSREKTRNHVHRVLLEDLEDPDAFARFYAVFHADSLLSEEKLTNHAAKLLRDTERKQQDVGDKLYSLYDEQRLRLIHVLQSEKGVGDLDTAIRTAQKLLDRVLFIAFAEDRKILDAGDVLEATFLRTTFMTSAWGEFRLLFRACNQGHARSGIPEFNGGLFAFDPILDDPAFELDDSWPNVFKTIGGYDFQNEVSVEVLGHIFEQSIPDLEKLREQGVDAYLAEREGQRAKKPGRRKREGVFYTHKSIVEYLIGAALDPAFVSARAELAESHQVDPGAAVPPAAYTRALLAWLDGLTVCDPACGSGAFLIGAYEWFEAHRLALLEDLNDAEPDAPECAGGRADWQARTAARVLGHNIHGVDLAVEAIEIARLSLWIRTARRDRKLTDLSRNVVHGNSVVDDATVDPRAFDWRSGFPGVFARGGFDAVIGNPPYVRQEWISSLKPHLAERFQAYHGMADLYVYFYERGIQVLRPGGRLAFVVTNKWMKAGYGEPLRKLFAEQAWVEQVIDFGHAKQFFPDADVFPCFFVARKPLSESPSGLARICILPREMVRLDELKAQVAQRGRDIGLHRFSNGGWSLEPAESLELSRKIRERGIALAEFEGSAPLMGIKTGFNEAFLLDEESKNRLVLQDPQSLELFSPYLRGQDIDRWHPSWAKLWMIALKSSSDHSWPWSELGGGAEACFAATYPGVHRHLKRFEPALIARQDQGRFWWELRSCAYWDEFGKIKLLYQDITWKPNFCLDSLNTLCNNTVYFLPNVSHWSLAVLNSSVGWWYSWRAAQHGKDEALRLFTAFMENYPIPEPPKGGAPEIESLVQELIDTTKSIQSTQGTMVDWLKSEVEIRSPTQRLNNLTALDADSFIAEVRKSRGKANPIGPGLLKGLREEYTRNIDPARRKAARGVVLERRLNDLVNQAYGLTPEEVRLIWDTAPPRMPIGRPDGI